MVYVQGIQCYCRKDALTSTYTCKKYTDITYTCTLHFSKSLNLLYMYKPVFKKKEKV